MSLHKDFRDFLPARDMRLTVSDAPLNEAETESARRMTAREAARMAPTGAPSLPGMPFNGLKAVLADEGDGDFTLYASDYAAYSANLRAEAEFNRPFAPIGVTIGLVTA